MKRKISRFMNCHESAEFSLTFSGTDLFDVVKIVRQTATGFLLLSRLHLFFSASYANAKRAVMSAFCSVSCELVLFEFSARFNVNSAPRCESECQRDCAASRSFDVL